MKTRSLMVAAVLIAALFGMVTPAAASTPLDVTITVYMVPDPLNPDSGLWVGTFEATGAAVDAGLLCSNGTERDLERHLGGVPSRRLVTAQVRKLFTCSGGGSFELVVNALVSPKGKTGHWVITWGDGSYTALLGNGGFTSIDLPNAAVDTFYGQLQTR